MKGPIVGVAVPPGTPGDVKKVLEKAFAQVNQDPEVIKKMEDLGFIMEDFGEADAKKLVERLSGYYQQLLLDLGLLKTKK